MKTSEKLDQIAHELEDVRISLRHLILGLPDGRTQDLADFILTRTRVDVESLLREAAVLRRLDD